MFSACLSKSVLEILHDRCLTYDSAAALCKLSSRQLGNILRLHSNTSLESLENICSGLKKSPNELLGFPADTPEIARLIPSEVIYVPLISRRSVSTSIFVCPACDSDLIDSHWAYCPFCGQKLLWKFDSRSAIP